MLDSLPIVSIARCVRPWGLARGASFACEWGPIIIRAAAGAAGFLHGRPAAGPPAVAPAILPFHVAFATPLLVFPRPSARGGFLVAR